MLKFAVSAREMSDLAPLLAHCVRTKQPKKLAEIVKTALQKPKNASETDETGDFFAKNAEIGAFSANFRAEFDEIATENAISGLAFGKMWHAAHKIGLLGLENGRLNRGSYAALIFAFSQQKGKNGAKMANFWLRELILDEKLEKTPLPHFSPVGLKYSAGFDWLIRRNGWFGEIGGATGIARAMVGLGFSPDHSTVLALSGLGTEHNTPRPSPFLRRRQAVPADQMVHGAEGSHGAASRRVSANRGISASGILAFSPDGVLEGLSVGLPGVRECGSEVVGAARGLEAVVAKRVKGGVFPGPADE